MLELRRAAERGVANFGWLDSRHTFSFGHYHDPKQVGFSDLLVINDDRVEPGMGFGTHPHRDMEIFSYVLEGALEHKDSMGTGSVIRPGDVQMMSAGSGITHSEFNPSRQEGVHFLQIWIVPDRQRVAPRYQQKNFSRRRKTRPPAPDHFPRRRGRRARRVSGRAGVCGPVRRRRSGGVRGGGGALRLCSHRARQPARQWHADVGRRWRAHSRCRRAALRWRRGCGSAAVRPAAAGTAKVAPRKSALATRRFRRAAVAIPPGSAARRSPGCRTRKPFHRRCGSPAGAPVHRPRPRRAQ